MDIGKIMGAKLEKPYVLSSGRVVEYTAELIDEAMFAVSASENVPHETSSQQAFDKSKEDRSTKKSELLAEIERLGLTEELNGRLEEKRRQDHAATASSSRDGVRDSRYRR